MDEEKRLGFIGVVINDRAVAAEVNATLGQYAHVIRARIGVPDADTCAAVIGLNGDFIAGARLDPEAAHILARDAAALVLRGLGVAPAAALATAAAEAADIFKEVP